MWSLCKQTHYMQKNIRKSAKKYLLLPYKAIQYAMKREMRYIKYANQFK